MLDYKQICEQVIAITKQTGEFIRTEAKAFDRSRVEHKGLNDMVSYVDKQAEEQLVAGLITILPECGFITEEGTSKAEHDVYRWIIDPLDGTTNFIHGLPIFSISVALMERDEIVIGVVYEINQDECFSATKGGGAFLNGKQLRVSGTQTLQESLICTGFNYNDVSKLEPFLKILSSFMQKSHGFRRLGSAAVDLAYVAAGRFEAFFEFNLNSYDVAAGVLLVTEAGGQVTKFNGSGDPVFGRELLASNKFIHREACAVIMEIWE